MADLQRLRDKGFTEVDIVGKRKFRDSLNEPETPARDKLVVRAHHPKHGWMYEKIAEGDDAALDAWAERATKADRSAFRPQRAR